MVEASLRGYSVWREVAEEAVCVCVCTSERELFIHVDYSINCSSKYNHYRFYRFGM